MTTDIALAKRQAEEQALCEASAIKLVAYLRAAEERAWHTDFWLRELDGAYGEQEGRPEPDGEFERCLSIMGELLQWMANHVRLLYEERVGRPLPDPDGE